MTGYHLFRILPPLFLVLLLSGCAMLPFGERITTEGLEAKGRDEATGIRGFAFGHGVGGDPEEARQMAAEDLAHQLLTHVRSEVRISERELQHEEQRSHVSSLERELESSAAALANAALEGMEVDLRVRADDGWYVRLRVAQDRMEELRQRVRRQAPALAQFELTSQVDDNLPGRRLRAALRGLAVVERTGVRDEQVYHPATGATTFGSYFQHIIVESVEALQVIPLVEGNRVRFAIIQRETLAPQPGTAIAVGPVELRSGADGITNSVTIAELGGTANVYALGYASSLGDGDEGGTWAYPNRSLLYVTALDPADWDDITTVEVLVHTDPPGVLAALNGNEQVTPARFLADIGAVRTLDIATTSDHRGHRSSVDLTHESPYAYLSVSLTERRFGQLQLKADGGRSRIRVEGKNGQWQTQNNRLSQPVEVGRYTISVFRDSNGDYQRITDEVTILEDQVIQRDYAAPIYREPYSRGFRAGINLLRLGGGPTANYTLPWAFGEDLDYDAFTSRYDTSEDGLNIDLVGHGQRFFNRGNLTLQGELGFRSRTFAIGRTDPDTTGDSERDKLMTTDEGDLTLSGLHASLGLGFWHEVGGGTAWLTGNQGFESMSWGEDSQVAVRRGTDDYETSSLPSSSRTASYQYAEIGFALRNGFTMALRLPADTVGAHLTIGFSALLIQRGYNHPATIRAARGLHY